MNKVAARLDAIDVLRGVTIIEMLSAHFAAYFPNGIALAITYTETAMALFVLLSGFMVGWRINAFDIRPLGVSRDLWMRAAKIFVVQLVLVLTAGVAVYAFDLYGAANGKSFARFLGESLLLYNQVGLIHILPTFLPLFVIAPIILLTIAARHNLLLFAASAAVFALGHFHPYALNYGAPAIFPFVMFQLYFVVGGIAGSRARRFGMIESHPAGRYLIAALIALSATMAWVHMKFVPAGTVSTHPLNFFGLVYHTPLIAVVVFGVLRFEPNFRGWPGAGVIARFGRNALLAFVLHVYVAVGLKALNVMKPMPMALNVMAIAGSIVVMNLILRHYEALRHGPDPPAWVRGVSLLFS